MTGRPELALAARAACATPTVPVAGNTKVIVCVAVNTWNDCTTGVAAAKLGLPAWLAESVQVPADTNVSVVPATVQTVGVVDTKLTGKPDEAVATSAPAGVPMVLLPGDVKMMVCAAVDTVKVCVTAVAGLKLALPAWLADTVQDPAATRVSAVPLIVQMAGVVEARVTGKPELDVATSAAGVLPKVWLPGEVKLMVCAIGPGGLTATVRVTATAAAKEALPVWLAVKEQLPAATRVSALPLVVQTAGVVDTIVTGKPELALAASAAGVVPSVCGPGPAKVMVCAAAATAKDCCTALACATVVLPAWLALIVQVPVVSSDKALPLTVHTAGVLLAKVTASPEVALATSVGGVLPRVCAPGEAKVMVCGVAATVNEFNTAAAAPKVVLPAWLAATVQVPGSSSVKAAPFTVQMVGVVLANATGRPELAVATRAGAALPRTWLPGAVKVMVWAAICTATAKVCATWGAAA